jgi:transcriptional regulator with XRE-family HTH domain
VLALDWRSIRKRRIALGIAETVLSEILGVSPMTVDSFAHGGDQSRLTLDFLSDLADVLGVTVADLFTGWKPPPPDDAPDGVRDDDPAILGRHLAVVGRLHLDAAAQKRGWTVGRVRWALVNLEERLAATGQTLAWIADTEVVLAPAPGDDTITDEVSRRDLRAYGLTEPDSVSSTCKPGGVTPGKDNLLRAYVMCLTSGPLHRYSDLDAVALGRLRAAGLVTTEILFAPRQTRKGGRSAEGARITGDARFNLCLDDG